MKIEDILNTFSDINHMYNNSTVYDTLEHMLHQLVEDVSFAASHEGGEHTIKMSDVDKEVEELIATNGVRGAEVIIGALVRAMKSRDVFSRIGAGAYGPS